MYFTTSKQLSISLFMCFIIFNFGQIKMMFRGDENLKKNYCKCKCLRYSNLLKTDTYFRTNCCLDINLKQNRFEIKQNTI